TLALAYSMGLLALACSAVRVRNIVFFNGEGDFTVLPLAAAVDNTPGTPGAKVLDPARVDAGFGAREPGSTAAAGG
ncbi:hypothetical protein N0V95_009044, partial [Ascochyta clinopodiicola]